MESAACGSHQEDQGIAALRRVRDARQLDDPAGNWVIHSTQLSIGVCLYHLRQLVESESTLLAAVSGLETARGPSFNRTQDGYRALRDLYTARWQNRCSRLFGIARFRPERRAAAARVSRSFFPRLIRNPKPLRLSP